VEQALSIGQQIAKAISAAHKKGIVHRDLKPGNIKITPDGQVKVLDFGLAKAPAGEGKNSEITQTQPGRVIGTPAYMSPEQARGEETDHRTDIWSFGCIMYQMLTGKLPFEGQTATDTLARIIEREPDWDALPQEIPTSIRVLVQRCLEKDPYSRPSDIAEAITEITATLSAPSMTSPPKLTRTTAIVSAAVIVVLAPVAVWFAVNERARPLSKDIWLAVLPFENVGSDEDEWFADGTTSEITDRLAGIRGLAVISRQSAFTYKNRKIATRQIAKELSVSYVLTGTVQCEPRSQPNNTALDPNSAVRIGVQLIRAADDKVVWAQPYDGDMHDILWLQSDIAENVAQALDMTLLAPKRQALGSETTEDTEAYICLLRGKEYFGRLSENDQGTAIEMYERAIELDPNLAPAYAVLSNAYTHMVWIYGWNREYLVRAREQVNRAFELDPDLPEANLALARYYYQGHLDYGRALEHLKIIRESYPNHHRMLYWTSVIQARQGNFEQALVNAKRSFQLNPRAGHVAANVGYRLVSLRRYSEAEDYYDKAIVRNPERPYYYLTKARLYLVWQGNTNEAREIIDEAMLNIDKDKDEYVAEIYHAGAIIDIYDGEYEEALKKLSLESKYFGNAPCSPHIEIDLRRAEVYGYMDNEEFEQQYYKSATAALKEKLLEDPNNAQYHSLLGIAYAGLGDRDEAAIREGERGAELCRETKDATVAPHRIEDLARIYVMVGDFDAAIDQIEDLLSIPSGLSIPLLRLDPAWEPLREHPDFKKLIASEE
jgi:TolB-like protein/Flp pilus assembly protein TadD